MKQNQSSETQSILTAQMLLPIACCEVTTGKQMQEAVVCINISRRRDQFYEACFVKDSCSSVLSQERCLTAKEAQIQMISVRPNLLFQFNSP